MVTTSKISVRLFVFYLSLRLVWVCEIEISHMGKNNGNPDLVCDNRLSHLSRLGDRRIVDSCYLLTSL